MTTAHLESGMNKNERRIWIEGTSYFKPSGLSCGTFLYRTMNDDGTMTLSTTADPTIKQRRHRIAGKPGREILDLCGKWVTAFMGNCSHFTAEISPAGITITPC